MSLGRKPTVINFEGQMNLSRFTGNIIVTVTCIKSPSMVTCLLYSISSEQAFIYL